MTLAQDAERLDNMADEVCQILKRLETYVQKAERGHMPYDVHAFVGGNCGNLRRSATMVRELERWLNR